MINPKHLVQHVIRPTLLNMGMWSQSAECLLIGTVAVESAMGTSLVQNRGPAVGIYQIEPKTAQDLLRRYLSNRPTIDYRFQNGFVTFESPPIHWDKVTNDEISQRLIVDLSFSTALARIKYWSIPFPLPDHKDIEGLANYWKQHYNTRKGKGKVTDFIDAYPKRLKPYDRSATGFTARS